MFFCFFEERLFPPVNREALTLRGTCKALASGNFCLDSFTASDLASVLHPHLVAERASSN